MIMMDRIEFIRYRISNRMRWFVNTCLRRLGMNALPPKLTIDNRKIASDMEGNRKLYELISAGKPFCAVRSGGTELQTLCEMDSVLLGLKNKPSQKMADKLQRQSGFFPADLELLYRFRDVYSAASKHADVLFTYPDISMTDYYLKKYIDRSVPMFDAKALEPFYYRHQQPWSRALAGKRVLVIHPFAETIQQQYKKREHLFDDPEVLPKFELHTLKAVQTIVGTKDERFDTWFDALDWMYEEAMIIPFDVALLACGAYGFPLTVKLKEAGKQAIYVGGGLQLLFGIRGKRWDLHFPEITAMYNDAWVRPSDEETPKNKAANEDQGAYW